MKTTKLTSLLTAAAMLLSPASLLTTYAQEVKETQASLSDSKSTEESKETSETPDYYDLYSDNSLNIPPTEEGAFLTTTRGEFDYMDHENGTVGFLGTRISGIRYIQIPYEIDWYNEKSTVSSVNYTALESNEYAEVVELPNTVEAIRGKAFRNMKSVKRIYVPCSVRNIADDAFDSMPADFKLICAKDSYAEEYAKTHGIPYAYPQDDDFDKESVRNSQRSINDLIISINGDIENDLPIVFEYTGYEIMPEVMIIENGRELNPDVDYTVRYGHNKDVGTAYMTITGINNYRGVCNYSFEIKKIEDIIPFDINKSHNFYDLYTDNGVNIAKPWVGSFDTVISGNYEFQFNDNGTVDFIGADEGIMYLKIPAIIDYGYRYDRPDIVVGVRQYSLRGNESAQVVELPNTVISIHDGAFKGMKAIKRIYVPVSVKKIADDAFDDMPADFKMICVKDSYAEEYAKTHSIPYAYPEDDDFDKQSAEKAQPDIKDLETLIDGVVVNSTEIPLYYEYNGMEITPSVVIKDGDKTLALDTDYTVRYTQNKNVGTATIWLTGKGNYKGFCLYTFAITDYKDIMPYDPILGDIDGDNYVTSNDALLALRASVGSEILNNDQKDLADIDADGEVTSNDALEILRLSVKR